MVRNPFNTSDLQSGILFLSLSGILLHSLLLSQKYIYIMSLLFCILLLHTDIFFSLNKPITSNACICKVCVCMCVHACVGVKERERVSVCVHALMCDVK